MSALKSQIEAMSGTVAAPASAVVTSQVARYILSDLKGGEHKRTFMLSLVNGAIREAYKGNPRDITDSLTLCAGKSVKARAYLAGFTTVKDVSKFVDPRTGKAYSGKWDSTENKAVRDGVELATQAAMSLFVAAYDAVFASDKTKREADKASKAQAKTAPVAETAAPVSTGESAEARQHDAAAALDSNVSAMIHAVRTGMLTLTQLEELTDACRAAETAALLASVADTAPVAPVVTKSKSKGRKQAVANA